MTAQPLSARIQPTSIATDTRATGEISGMRAVLLGGLTVGILDILDAIVFFGLYLDAPPIRILQSVAAGLLGRDAARAGGLPTAVLGGVLHFTIAMIMRRSTTSSADDGRWLTRRAVACGLAYGVVCYFVMSFVVIPLSAAGRGLHWPPLPIVLNGIIGHALLVGLPAALWARRATR